MSSLRAIRATAIVAAAGPAFSITQSPSGASGPFTAAFLTGTRVSVARGAELTGTISVSSIGGFSLSGSPAMEVLSLDTPQTEIAGSVVVGGNAALRDVGSLGHVTSIGRTLGFVNSPALVTTPRFVTHVGGDLILQNNPALLDLGFDSLRRIGDRLLVEGLFALTTIELPALTQADQIFVMSNPELRHLGVPVLASADMFVNDNRHLPACEVEAVFARVTGTHVQARNDETATCTAAP